MKWPQKGTKEKVFFSVFSAFLCGKGVLAFLLCPPLPMRRRGRQKSRKSLISTIVLVGSTRFFAHSGGLSRAAEAPQAQSHPVKLSRTQSNQRPLNASCLSSKADIFSPMPKISLSVAHQLGQEEAKNRLAGLIADSRSRFAGQVSQVAESWNGFVNAISFQAMGFSVTGKLDVQPAQVMIELNLPWAAYPFKGRIENEILTHARQLLA
jgi:hypothetical protein